MKCVSHSFAELHQPHGLFEVAEQASTKTAATMVEFGPDEIFSGKLKFGESFEETLALN